MLLLSEDMRPLLIVCDSLEDGSLKATFFLLGGDGDSWKSMYSDYPSSLFGDTELYLDAWFCLLYTN